MRSTGKFDINGQEIFEGDKVVKWWRYGFYNMTKIYMVHTITPKPAYKMGDGEMRDDGNGIIFCLGNFYNLWKGSEVQKITPEEYNKLGVPDDTEFYYRDGVPVIYGINQK